MSVHMRHPDLDEEITVPSSAVPFHRAAGWQVIEGQADMGEELPPEARPFEGQPLVRMRHPDLDEEITVPESAVPAHRSNGWQIVEDGAETGAVAEDLDGKTVEELREVARDRGLKVSGTRPELLARLTGAEQEDHEQQAPATAGQTEEGE